VSVVVTALTFFPKLLGLSGTVLAFVSIIGLILFFKFVELVERVYGKCRKHWRRLPVWGRQIVMFLAALIVWKMLWPVFPKTAGSVAVVLSLWTFWWVQGARHASAYGLTDTSPRKAWEHHWDVTRAARQHTAALHDGTGKKGGKARRPKITPNGMEFTVQPEHGMSAQETADLYNDGKMHSALIDRYGQDAVQDVVAEDAGDGTVRANVLRSQTKDDFFASARPWTGMEEA
jgi:hypothetical protein